MIKNLRKYIFAFFVATALVSLVGCAGGPKQSSAGEYVDDTVITARVKAAMVEDPDLKAMQINVETFKGEVQLSGFVDSRAQVDKASAVTRKVPGVKSVKNDIRLR